MKKLSPQIKGAIFATLAALSMSTSMSLAKNLDKELPTSLIVFVRSLFGLMFFVPFLVKNRAEFVRSTNHRLQFIRVIFVVSSMLCTYYTYRHLPIAFATSIGMTSALFTTVFSAIILNDKIGIHKWMVIFVGYCGVIMVIKPTSYVIDFAVLVAIMANIFAALAIISAKVLSRSDSTVTIMFYSNIGITLLSFVINSYNCGWQSLNTNEIGILLLTGAFGITTQFCSLTALKYGSPSFLAPFEYTRMFFAVVIGFIIFHEVPPILVIVGSLLIIISTYVLTYLEQKNQKG